MEQGQYGTLIAAMIAVNGENISITDYHNAIDQLLRGISQNDRVEIAKEVDVRMHKWREGWGKGHATANPYTQLSGYFHPAGAA